jgi:hypothetical protein
MFLRAFFPFRADERARLGGPRKAEDWQAGNYHVVTIHYSTNIRLAAIIWTEPPLKEKV